jgi:hypothetical protein
MNPGHRSPAALHVDPAYETVSLRQVVSYPSSCEVVVRHRESGTYWSAHYSIREDDSDYALSATWRKVMPKVVTVTEYVPVTAG